MFLQNSKKSRIGFTLIELAIVLSVVGTVTAGLWRISSNSNQQSKDQATAQQQSALINAIKGFLADQSGYSAGAAIPGVQWGGQAFMANLGAGAAAATLTIPGACPSAALTGTDHVLCTYLPPGIVAGTLTPYGHTFKIQVKPGATSAGQNYSFMIASIIPAGGNSIPDADGGRISGLIGGEGGFNFASAVCGAISTKSACGTMGTWTIPDITASYGFTAPTADGYVVSLSTPSTSTAGLNNQWLARSIQPGDDPRSAPAGSNFIYNTMSADLFMGPYNAATDTLPYPPYGSPLTSVPSIHLHQGYIEGDGITTTTGNFAQIFLSQTTANSDTYQKPLIQLATGCLSSTDTLCPPGLQVLGDVDASGYITAGKIYSASDVRLKTNIHPITNALDDMMRLKPVTFDFKATKSKGMGVIAQELEKIYPQLVSETKGTKYVDYNGLIGPLIGAVQELKRQNDDLRDQLQKQSMREQQLEQEIKLHNKD